MKKIFQLNMLTVLLVSCIALLIALVDSFIVGDVNSHQDLSIVGKSSIIVMYIGMGYMLIKTVISLFR